MLEKINYTTFLLKKYFIIFFRIFQDDPTAEIVINKTDV